MPTDDRIALLLAARLIENGVDPGALELERLALGEEGGHVNVGLTLADRLSRAVRDPEEAREIAASLRAAAGDPAGI